MNSQINPSNKIKTYLSILVALILSTLSITIAKGQETYVDSLQQLLKGNLNDTSRIYFQSQLINEYYQDYPDSAIKVAHTLFEDASRVNYARGQAINLIHQGRSYLIKEDYLHALDHLLLSLNYADYYDSNKITAATHFELGKVYTGLNNFLFTEAVTQKIINYNKQAIHGFDKLINDPDAPLMVASAHLEIGRAYMRMPSFIESFSDSGRFHFRQARSIFERAGIHLYTAQIYQDLALLYLRAEQYDSALFMAHLNKSTLQKADLKEYVPNAFNLIARTHERNHDYDSAHYYANKSIAWQLQSGQTQFLTNAYEVQAETYLKEGDYKKAIKFFNEELNLAQKLGDFLGKSVAYNNLVECYKRTGDFKNALHMSELVIQLTDSAKVENDATKMANLHALFESTQQQKQMDWLSKEAELSKLKSKRNQLLTAIIGVSLVVSVIIILLIVRQYRLIKKSKEEQVRLFAEMDQMKSRFFANISHEFRTPLTLMLTPLERLIDQEDTPERKDLWNMMKRSCQRLLDLVNQLLDLSKLEAGKMTLQLQRINLTEWLKPIIGQFSSIAESRDIQFVTLLQPNVVLPVDREKMEQVILNLLSNAFKFTPNSGKIELTMSSRENQASIVIMDSGIGIPPDKVQYIFDRFYQVDDSNLREYEGTGIGLALSKELVELHKGTLTVSSELGKCSCFTVLLPDHPEVKNDPDQVQPKISAMIKASLVTTLEEVELESDQRPRILIVEDNSDLQKYLAHELGKNYRIIVASNGQEGLELAIDQIPDLIITDLMMPKMDGLALSRQMKMLEKTSHIPIILLTAKADQHVKTEGLQTGADDYIPKPFHLSELLVRVQNLIESRKRLRKLFSAQISLKPSDIQGVSLEDRFIKKVLESIEKNLANASFGVEPLAEAVAMSSVQLYRKMKAITGKTPNEVIREVRLERAASMLQQNIGNVAEIAYHVGFTNLSYFSKCFKEKFSETPSDYSKKNRQ